jgi:DNA-binding LacI/PurR family transcriptional regulator
MLHISAQLKRMEAWAGESRLKILRAGDLPQTNQFYAPMLVGIEAACRKQQINMLYATVPVDQDNHPVELPRMLQGDGLDGLLLGGAFVDATIERLMQRDADRAPIGMHDSRRVIL